ncbi:hypothetical protein BC827DRAFT_1203467 [Russula dissimulans]|nr:hypothetical protein BC827DRAFT_1203467 [Russula dissimulans]
MTTAQSVCSSLCTTRSSRGSWSNGGSTRRKNANGRQELRRTSNVTSVPYTEVARRWLTAISLSKSPNVMSPLINDETIRLFVQFFWLIKTGDRQKANQLLVDARRGWRLETRFDTWSVDQFLASGDDYAFSTSAITSHWTVPPKFGGQASRSVSKGMGKGKVVNESTQVLKTKVLKRNGRSVSATSKRSAITQPGFKKKRSLSAKVRLTTKGTNSATDPVKRVTNTGDVDVVDLGGIPPDSERNCGHEDIKSPHPLVSPKVAAGRSLVTEPNERVSKKAKMTKTESSRKQSSRTSSQHNARSPRSTGKPKTPAKATEGGAIAEPSRSPVHVEEDELNIGGVPFAFDSAGVDVPEDEDDPYGCTLSEYPDISSVELEKLEKERRVAVSPRPPLPVTPPIWAQSRQEVCESLDSFRSFQGGVYHSNDIVKGYLLGAHSSSRDLFHHDGKLIISHGGGKAEALHWKNRRLQVQGPADQLEDDRSVRALLNNYKSRRPLVVLADDNYVLFPFDLTAGGYTYVVLGLYWIAHAWAELQQVDENHSVVRYKFAFQWCEGQGDPWWQSRTENPVVTQEPDNPLRDDELDIITPEKQENLASGERLTQYKIRNYFCRRCGLKSLVVYEDAPMCLQPSCAEFCIVYQATEDSPQPTQTFSYSTELLRLRPANHQPVSADSLYPPLPTEGSTTSRPFAKGIHCRDCGRLSTRFKWEHYECSHCHRIYEAPRFVFSHKDFWLQEQALKFYQHRVAEDSGIVIRGLEFRSRARGSGLPYIQTFDLPHNRGHVHLIPGHPSINMEANVLFRDYQTQAACGEIQFRRWPLRAVSRGQLLSNYFSQNTGAPYQYIGGAERTTPLELGPKAVLGALALIKNRIGTALGRDIPFNEVLSAAYMEKQKMAFHSDSERGLGPVVASLSLGSAAEMHFRLHSKYTETGSHRKVVMSLVLRHGDVLIMEGAGVQEYYEHTVIPKNFRIVATARFISPENYT